MATADDMRKKYFTDKGQDALLTRLHSLIGLYENSNTQYPFNKQMLGFVTLSIPSKEALLHMINELRQILGLKKVVIKEKDDHGRVQIIEVK